LSSPLMGCLKIGFGFQSKLERSWRP